MLTVLCLGNDANVIRKTNTIVWQTANVYEHCLPLKKLFVSFLEKIYNNDPKQCNLVIPQMSNAEVCFKGPTYL